MSWIRAIPYEESGGRLRRLYDRVKGPGGYIDNILTLHGLRPHSLEGHMALYKSVLHHSGNRLPKWLLETIGVYVSLLNRCDYCVEHHLVGLERQLGDEGRMVEIREALESGEPGRALDARETAALRHAERLTLTPGDADRSWIRELREAGFDDGEILEINQVVSYFAYANRTVLGLGGTTEGDVLGLSPGDVEDPESWRHG